MALNLGSPTTTSFVFDGFFVKFPFWSNGTTLTKSVRWFWGRDPAIPSLVSAGVMRTGANAPSFVINLAEGAAEDSLEPGARCADQVRVGKCRTPGPGRGDEGNGSGRRETVVYFYEGVIDIYSLFLPARQDCCLVDPRWPGVR